MIGGEVMKKAVSSDEELSGNQKTCFSLSRKALKVLREVASREGQNMSYILARAILCFSLLLETQRNGGKILIQNGTETKEIVLF